jgi:cytochrome c-type biogenesis protein CcmH
MILFWIIAGLLTLAAAMALAAPLFDTRKFKSEDVFALEVYRDQLGELTRDEQRGLLSAEQARAAQIEIERRILALDEGKTFQPARPPSHRLTLAMAVILPLAGFGLYLVLGSPQLPSQSAMERLAEERQRTSPEIQALEATVAASPSDVQGWIDLGRAYAGVERAKDAADSFAKAMALGRAEPDLLRQYAHATILAEQGRVTADAQVALRRVLSTDPTDPTARFFLALGKAQNDDVEGALTDWLALERELPAEAPLRTLVAENIDRAARQLGKDPAKLPGRCAVAGGNAGPSADDMAAAAQMTPEQRQAFIESMVARLAAKMKQNPDDVEGWIKLANA